MAIQKKLLNTDCGAYWPHRKAIAMAVSPAVAEFWLLEVKMDVIVDVFFVSLSLRFFGTEVFSLSLYC